MSSQLVLATLRATVEADRSRARPFSQLSARASKSRRRARGLYRRRRGARRGLGRDRGLEGPSLTGAPTARVSMRALDSAGTPVS
jgi:hypothetical protein